MSAEKIATIERRCQMAVTNESRADEYFSSFDPGDKVALC